MTKQNHNRIKWIWLSALTLFVCVAATTVVCWDRLDSFMPDDEGAISLIAEGAPRMDQSSNGIEEMQHSEGTAVESPETAQVSGGAPEAAASTEPQAVQPSQKPGFEASDGNTRWNTSTQVEIFRVSYENGEQVITVNSDGGDKLIAPGTDNSYTFKLKNTGNVALDYTVAVDAYVTPAEIELPVTGRWNRYDGTWIVGGPEEYTTVDALDTAEDHATLGAGKYTYYTLDWRWPFESGNDEGDTLLGNLAVEQDLVFSIVIHTTATANLDPNEDGGITPPNTGDDTDLVLWILLAVGSFAVMMFLLLDRDGEKRRNRAEADRH